MIHDRKLIHANRKRSDNIPPESKLFLNEYADEMFKLVKKVMKDKFNRYACQL